MASVSKLKVGVPVTVSRDEEKYPSKGTWPKYRGRKGTITVVVTDRRPRLTEYGVIFGPVRERPDGSLHGNGDDEPVWFQRHELELT